MIDLSHRLAEPWMWNRLGSKNLSRNLRQNINDILKIPTQTERDAPQERKRKICILSK